ncbi:hypothetical protein MSAN_00598400 [Mycena sanguinolenta]|uniref:GATA-type domain-containing protein n=1 Tax=Mycena sanguinolenta TaxID=230812 RepID=A0A8H6ZAX1_9AGAR|nr:hypothetical protein MSAN_00598400 [Mycena sanguinolenta]
MPGILNLKFKGNKSFVAFSNLSDSESLTKTWKVCTKVASYLEQGQRLENLSWRLWHLQNLMVDTDNAKSKREFKKLSKCMGDKLDKEKGRSIESLPAPDFKRNPSTDLIRQRAVEKERTREASVQGPEHIIQRMQFTFAVEPVASSSASTTSTGGGASTSSTSAGTAVGANKEKEKDKTAAANNKATSPTSANKRKRDNDNNDNTSARSVRLPTLFSTGFDPAALLYAAPTLGARKNYGEAGLAVHSSYPSASTNNSGNGTNPGGNNANSNNGADAGRARGRNGNGAGDMRIARPTIELPLDELLNAEMEDEFGDYMEGVEDDDSQSSSGNSVDNSSGFSSSAAGASSVSAGPNASNAEDHWMVGLYDIMHGAGTGGMQGNVGGGMSAGMGGFDVYAQEHAGQTGTFDVPLTLDPHAAFAHHFHNQHQPNGPNGSGAARSANPNSTSSQSAAHPGDASTPVAGPHLSPNAYFLHELDEDDVDHGHDAVVGVGMEPDTQRATPTSSSHNPNPGSGSPTIKASDVYKSRGGTASRRTKDMYADFDLDAESSDDGGDDSADSDFFDKTLSAARRRRQSAPRGQGALVPVGVVRRRPRPERVRGGRRLRGAQGRGRRPWVRRREAVGRRPVLSVKVPVRGGAGQGMRPPAEVPLRDQPASSSTSASAPGSASAPTSASGAGSAGGSAGGGGGSTTVPLLHNNSAPGGVKAECSNCGATHTPLWRRGLNDELNCNACGLYCKLHKRPRPKTMRNNNGGAEGRGQSVRAEAVDVLAQCYNCHTTATPLWRKDDEGKTVCNACGLYYKLHGSARPISMKSDIIRKRSRHDARRGGASASVSETPTASPGVSRRASPAPNGPASSASTTAGRASPTLAPDSTTTSELSSALGPKPYGHPYSYHEQYPDALPFASVDVSNELDGGAQSQQQPQRANKRRRMSVDSASEPPSSAISYGSYADEYASASSQFSVEFPFSRFHNGGYNNGGENNGGGGGGSGAAGLRGGGGANTFWHPPMMLQDSPNGSSNSPSAFLHPPMLPPPEEAPMDYLHPPMVLRNDYHQQEEGLNNFFGGFMGISGIHPPMLPGDDAQMSGMGMIHPPMMPYEDIYDSNGNMLY